MDRDRFDAWTRLLAANGHTRRSFAGLAAAALAMLTLGPASRDDAAARKRSNTRPRRHRNRSGGRVDAQIIGGQDVPDGTYPFIAALLDLTYGGTAFEQQFCGGALIDPSYVLTAAHCAVDYAGDSSDLRVVVGRTRLSNSTGATRAVNRVLIHPAYDPDTKRHDAALLELTSPVTIVSPIALARPGNETLEQPETSLTVIGWGDTVPQPSGSHAFPDRLKSVNIRVRADQVCAENFSEYDGSIMICAGEFGKDSCFGDSGGPLFGTVDGVQRVAGIVSFGAGCGSATPGAYTEVNAQSICAFIAEELGTCGDPATDFHHCGACCNACPASTNQCVAGTCRCGEGPPCTGGRICDGAGACICPAGTVLCNDICQDASANPCSPAPSPQPRDKKKKRRKKKH